MAKIIMKREVRAQQFREQVPTVSTVEVLIDIDDIVQRLGSRAIFSKGGKAIECGGAVVVRVLKR